MQKHASKYMLFDLRSCNNSMNGSNSSSIINSNNIITSLLYSIPKNLTLLLLIMEVRNILLKKSNRKFTRKQTMQQLKENVCSWLNFI